MAVYTIKIGDLTFYPIRASDKTAMRLAHRMLRVGETAEVYQGDRRVGTARRHGLFDDLVEKQDGLPDDL